MEWYIEVFVSVKPVSNEFIFINNGLVNDQLTILDAVPVKPMVSKVVKS